MASEDRVRAGLLYDLYGPLLTDHQQVVWRLYYLEDWSLGEISEAHEVSRSAIYDLLERTRRLMEDYEHRLGLLAQHRRRRERLREVLRLLHELPESHAAVRSVRRAITQLAEEEGLTDV